LSGGKVCILDNYVILAVCSNSDTVIKAANSAIR